MTQSFKVCAAAIGAAVLLGVAACGTGGGDDPTYHLTGTEQAALVSVLPDGGVGYYCPGKKALVCHIPPGNPANAHTICVGKPAVSAHARNHGDPAGVCDGGTVENPNPEGNPDGEPAGQPAGQSGDGTIGEGSATGGTTGDGSGTGGTTGDGSGTGGTGDGSGTGGGDDPVIN